MKWLDLVTGNFCHTTSTHFTNVHKQSSWDSQFKLLIYMQVYSNRRMRKNKCTKKFKQKKFDHYFFPFEFLFMLPE